MKIGIIDYGLSNLNSICNAVEKLDYKYELIQDDKKFDNCEKFILPGVGSFPTAVINLKKRGIFDKIKSAVVNDKKPILGICLGMQLFFESSEEDGGSNGLGILKGKVKELKPRKNLKVPNIGWKEIIIDKPGILLKDIEEKPIFYFVHKFACFCEEKNIVKSKLNYINEFECIVENKNIFATQFHPEKSQKLGFKILENFLKADG
tara:strand:- start:1902 stop:2519 length:618 start_codon:yes stop_codon:yes gene_type:complete